MHSSNFFLFLFLRNFHLRSRLQSNCPAAGRPTNAMHVSQFSSLIWFFCSIKICWLSQQLWVARALWLSSLLLCCVVLRCVVLFTFNDRLTIIRYAVPILLSFVHYFPPTFISFLHFHQSAATSNYGREMKNVKSDCAHAQLCGIFIHLLSEQRWLSLKTTVPWKFLRLLLAENIVFFTWRKKFKKLYRYIYLYIS